MEAEIQLMLKRFPDFSVSSLIHNWFDSKKGIRSSKTHSDMDRNCLMVTGPLVVELTPVKCHQRLVVTSNPDLAWKKAEIFNINGNGSDDRIQWILREVGQIPENLFWVKFSCSYFILGKRLKKIYLYSGLDYGMSPGQSRFLDHGCPVNQCSLTVRKEDEATADLVLFKDYVSKPSYVRPKNQIWVLFLLESPLHTSSFKEFTTEVKSYHSYINLFRVLTLSLPAYHCRP